MSDTSPPLDDNTERPDVERAQAALDRTPSDMLRTVQAVAENQRLLEIVRSKRRENHFVDKYRAIIVGASP